MFRSATFKLTLWYLAIITAIAVGFSIVIYHFATNALDTGLRHQTLRIFNNFPVFKGDPNISPTTDVAMGAHQILFRLIYFNVFVVVVAGVASYFLARYTLEPIQAAHERQKRFTADVSHELRTPLTALKMESEVTLLDKQSSKEDLRQALESNLEEAGKMDQLINNLLKLTKLDDDQVQANFKQLHTDDFLASAIEQVSKSAATKKITVKKDGKNVPVYGDHDSLVQLLVILLDNAIKYSPNGSTVTLSSEKTNDGSRLTVKDEGQGIAKADLPHVFNRFYRADSSRTKSDTNGFGIGLSIAKLISDRHHGNITLSSRQGHGTTATVTLPATAPTS